MNTPLTTATLSRLLRHDLFWLALSTPFLLFPGRWAPLFALPLVVPWLHRAVTQRRLTRPSPLNLPAALLAAMTLLAYSVSIDPAMSWAKLWGILLQAAIFFSLLNAIRTERAALHIGLLLVLLTGGVALLSIVGTDWSLVRLLPLDPLYDHIPGLVEGVPGSGVPSPTTLFHPREVGATMALLLPVPLVFLFFGRDRRLRLLSAGAVLLGSTMLLLSQAIMGFFGLALALSLILIWWRRWLLVVPLAAMAAASVAVFTYGPRQLALLMLDLQHPLGAGFVLRFDMWSRALAMIRDMPLTGIGLNTFPLVQSHFYTGYIIGPEVHAHNLFLQTAVDLGLPGLLLFLWLLVTFYLAVWQAYHRLQNRQLRLLLLGLAAGVLAYTAGGILDVMTLGAKPVAALWAFFGLAAALWANTREQAGTPSPRWPRRLPALAGTAALFLLVALLFLANPAVWWGNLGTIQAQQAVYQARTAGELPAALAGSAARHLNRAVAAHPDHAPFLGHLGSLHAWQGDETGALSLLERRVAADGPYALAHYAPFTRWRRTLQNEPAPAPWESTARLYTHWSNRFPQRAEEAVLLATVWAQHLGQPQRATTFVESRLASHARPAQLLTVAADHLPTE